MSNLSGGKVNYRKSQFSMILKNGEKIDGTYRLEKYLFNHLKSWLAPYRSLAPVAKTIKCVETGIVFERSKDVVSWLMKKGLTSYYRADIAVKQVCNGNKKIAYGYHWEYVDEK